MNATTKLAKVFRSSYFYSILNKAFHILFGFIGTVIVNRYLGVELRGEYAYIYNIISIAVIIGNLGIYQSYPYNKRKNIENINSLYVNLAIKQMLLYLFLLIIGASCYYGFFKPNFSDYIILLLSSTLLIVTITSHQISMITSVEFFNTKSIVVIFSEFTKFILLIIMYHLLERSLIPILIINIIYYVIIISVCTHKLAVPIRLKQSNFKFTIEVIKTGFIPMLFTLLLSLNYSIDILFLKLGGYVSLKDVGLYAVGVQLAGYIWVVPDIFKEVLYSKTAKDDSLIDIISCIKLSLLIESMFLLGIVLFGESIFRILYGLEYVEAVGVTRIIFIGILSMSLFKLLTPLYNAKGKFMGSFLILLSSIIINIILNFILIPRYRNTGAAVASVFGYSICGLVYLIRFKKEYNLKFKELLLFSKTDLRLIKSILK